MHDINALGLEGGPERLQLSYHGMLVPRPRISLQIHQEMETLVFPIVCRKICRECVG